MRNSLTGRLSLVALALFPLIAAAKPGIFHRQLKAQDGTPLALYRYVPEADTGEPPVLMVPDLGFNRHSLDDGGRGIARFFWERGREVLVLEPRGHGASGLHGAFHLSDIVLKDLVAFRRYLDESHTAQVDVLVHGYAGTLVLAAVSQELKGRVRRVVALSTPVEVECPNDFARTLLSSGGRLASMGEDPAQRKAWELLFAHRGSFRAGALGALAHDGVDDLGSTAAQELLTWMDAGDLRLSDGSSVRARTAALSVPTMLILGIADNWAHSEFATPLRQLAPLAHVRTRLLSKADLAGEDYSHLSFVAGQNAAPDIFIPAFRFLGPADDVAEVVP